MKKHLLLLVISVLLCISAAACYDSNDNTSQESSAVYEASHSESIDNSQSVSADSSSDESHTDDAENSYTAEQLYNALSADSVENPDLEQLHSYMEGKSVFPYPSVSGLQTKCSVINGKRVILYDLDFCKAYVIPITEEEAGRSNPLGMQIKNIVAPLLFQDSNAIMDYSTEYCNGTAFFQTSSQDGVCPRNAVFGYKNEYIIVIENQDDGWNDVFSKLLFNEILIYEKAPTFTADTVKASYRSANMLFTAIKLGDLPFESKTITVPKMEGFCYYGDAHAGADGSFYSLKMADNADINKIDTYFIFSAQLKKDPNAVKFGENDIWKLSDDLISSYTSKPFKSFEKVTVNGVNMIKYTFEKQFIDCESEYEPISYAWFENGMLLTAEAYYCGFGGKKFDFDINKLSFEDLDTSKWVTEPEVYQTLYRSLVGDIPEDMYMLKSEFFEKVAKNELHDENVLASEIDFAKLINNTVYEPQISGFKTSDIVIYTPCGRSYSYRAFPTVENSAGIEMLEFHVFVDNPACVVGDHGSIFSQNLTMNMEFGDNAPDNKTEIWKYSTEYFKKTVDGTEYTFAGMDGSLFGIIWTKGNTTFYLSGIKTPGCEFNIEDIEVLTTPLA